MMRFLAARRSDAEPFRSPIPLPSTITAFIAVPHIVKPRPSLHLPRVSSPPSNVLAHFRSSRFHDGRLPDGRIISPPTMSWFYSKKETLRQEVDWLIQQWEFR
jgi:hypothetical protein